MSSSSSTTSTSSITARLLGALVGATAGFTLLQYLNTNSNGMIRSGSGLVQLETPEESLTPCARAPDASDVSVSSKVLPFPTHIKVNGFDYVLLGTGTRRVSLFGFDVYVCGIYIRQEDIPKLPGVFGSATDRTSLFNQLMDPDIGQSLVSELLNSNIGISIRIVPVRKTDFGHLRDGFVRTLMAHPRFKFENEKGTIGRGITELKRIFSRKMAVPKGNILYLHRRRNGHLIAEYIEADQEGEGMSHVLGAVHEPVASELLFLQYLAGKKPSSLDARQSTIQTLARLGVGEQY